MEEKSHATAVEDVAAIMAPSKSEGSDEYQAAIATTVEHQLTFRKAMRYYKKAVFWSVMASMATVMESYDLQIIGSFYALPQFQQKYGVQLPSGAYSVPAQWQVALSVSSNIGLIIGTIANGYLSDRFGPKRVMLACHASLIGLIFITFFAPNVQVLLVGEILCGLPWGIFSSLAPAYAAEVSPLALRSYLTTFVNLCWVIGHILATGVLQSQIKNPTQWSYRLPLLYNGCGQSALLSSSHSLQNRHGGSPGKNAQIKPKLCCAVSSAHLKKLSIPRTPLP